MAEAKDGFGTLAKDLLGVVSHSKGEAVLSLARARDSEEKQRAALQRH